MDTKTIVGILGLIAGIAFMLIAFLRSGLPRQKRLIFVYAALCFFVFGALEYFGIIHLEALR